MSDNISTKNPDEEPATSENTLISASYDEICEALDVLYIPSNHSGRVHFMQAYPAAAAHIFGAELIVHDVEGGQDKEHLAVLEAEAEERQFELRDVAKSLKSKSASGGVLDKDYVDSVITTAGRDLALLLYAPRYVDAVFPPEKDLEVALMPEAAPPPQPVIVDTPEDGFEIPTEPITYAELLERIGKPSDN